MGIDNDDVVGLSPLVVTSVHHKVEANRVNVLKTAVKSDVEAARVVGVVATGGDVSVAKFSHGNGGSSEREGYKRRLIDRNDIRRISSHGRDERAVDPFQNVSGSIVTAVVHVRLAKEAAGVAKVLGDERMRGRDGEVHASLRGRDVVRVKVGHLFRDTQNELIIEGSMEDKYLRSLQVHRVIDSTSSKGILNRARQSGSRNQIGVLHARRKSHGDFRLRTFGNKTFRKSQ